MKKTLLLLCMLMSLFVTANAQTVTIGTGIGSTYEPFSSYYGFHRSAATYLNSEIVSTGTITHLSWYVGTTTTLTIPVKVYLKTVTATAQTASTWPNLITGATEVYSGNLSSSVTGWETIDITDFNYTGDNLMVLCEANYGAGGASPYAQFRYTTTGTTYLSQFIQKDNTAPTTELLGLSYSRPNIQLNFQPTSPTFSVTPTSKDFGILQPSSSSANQTFTISNIGIGTLSVNSAVSITGTDASQFVLTDINSYPQSLGASASFSVDVKFSPTTVGSKSANLHVVDNLTKVAHDIPLTGTCSNAITIGTGTSTALSLPMDCYFGYTYSQSVYLQSEVGTPGLISKIRYNYTGASFTENVAIYMENTTKTVFASATDWIPLSSLTQVYSGTLTTTPGWIEITLATPFDYNGTDNLVIAFDENTTGYHGGADDFYGTATTGNRSIRNTSDGTNPNPASPPTGTLVAGFPNIQIEKAAPIPMTFISSTSNQSSTNAVMTNTVNQQVIGIQITTNGTLTPLTLSKLIINANGTTNVADISNAIIYYTGTSSTFATTTQFGTTVTSPTTANFDVNGSQVLAGGTNYFWLTYDISATANIGNVVDGECTSTTVGGTDYTPTITAPTGNRTIKTALGGILTINPDGSGSSNYTSFANAVSDLQMLGVATGGVTFNVEKGKTFNESPLTITVSGTASNPIVFQAAGSATEKPIINFTGTSSTSDAGFKLIGSDYVTIDGLDIRDAVIATPTEIAFYLDGTTSVNNGCKNNTIKNCTVSLTRTSVNSRGIKTNAAPTSADGSNDNNKFLNNNISNVHYGYDIVNSSTAYQDLNNEIGAESGKTSFLSNIGSMAANVATCGVYYKNQIGIKIYRNDITLFPMVPYTAFGIMSDAGSVLSSAEIFNNNIHDITYVTTMFSAGIQVSTGSNRVYNNIVRSIYESSTSAGTHRLAGISSGGLYGAGKSKIYNNVVYDIKAPFSNHTVFGTAGIMTYGTTNTTNPAATDSVQIFNNTIYLNYSSTVSNISTGLLLYSSNSQPADVRNNIVVSLLSGASVNYSAAFKYASTTTTNLLNTTNNNLYYAGEPSTKNLIFHDGVNKRQDLAAYKAAIGIVRETNSISEMPTFKQTTTIPYNLSLETQLTAFATPVTEPFAIATDIYDNVRSTTTPTIGAFELGGSSVIESNFPEATTLSQNYPNPFNPTTAINFAIAKNSTVNLTVYNSKGEVVKTLINSNINAGNHTVNFNAEGLNSGVYIYKLTTPESSFTKKMIMIK